MISIQNATRGKSQNGLGVSKPGAPMYTLDVASQHAVAHPAITGTLCASGAGLNRAAGQANETDLCIVQRSVVGHGWEWIVRRLTPKECERLQGFPDLWTEVGYKGKNAPPDSPRYKALGNSMAVPCMAHIGRNLIEVA